ncbi:MAG TPA: hypothetical protein PKA28_04950 [Methylomusa anaerophila]|uniref:hypothetical protein n=1 Tax=Methylomusa anaerophila TaxID=1930071 RepID=UPI000F8394A6|nr:hypothetical protein [Methylomusa anaerophila]HML87778.1 hypothetical protein [Methylomusa anaerophila]
MEPKLYYAQKEQLLVKIDGLSRDLEQLRQSGNQQCILAVTNLLEESLRELTALRQANTSCNRWRKW